jgi:hypothetical protein
VADKEVHKLQGERVMQGNTPETFRQGWLEKPATEHRAALEKIRQGGIATKVRILVNHDCCPVCRSFEGAYSFDEAPELPQEGCSHPLGCRCYYAPVLDRFGP